MTREEIVDILSRFGAPVRRVSADVWYAIDRAEEVIAQRREDARWKALDGARARAGERLATKALSLTQVELTDALDSLWQADALIARRNGEAAEPRVAELESVLEKSGLGSVRSTGEAPPAVHPIDRHVDALLARAQAALQASQVSGDPWAFCLEQAILQTRQATGAGADPLPAQTWTATLQKLTSVPPPAESKALAAIVAAISATSRDLAALPNADRTAPAAELNRVRRALPSSASLASAARNDALDQAIATICAVQRLLRERGSRDADSLRPRLLEVERQALATPGATLRDLLETRRVLANAHAVLDSGAIPPTDLFERLDAAQTRLQHADQKLRQRERAQRAAALDALARLRRLGVSEAELPADAATISSTAGPSLCRLHRSILSRVGVEEGRLRRQAAGARERAEAWMGRQLRAPESDIEARFRDTGRALKELDRALAGEDSLAVRRAGIVVDRLIDDPHRGDRTTS